MKDVIVIKLSGEALGDQENAYNAETLRNIAKQIQTLQEEYSVAIVLGGGNILRGGGLAENLNISRSAADRVGMLSTEQNAIVLREFFAAMGIETRIASSIPGSFTEDFDPHQTKEYLAEGKVVLFSGGLAHPFFTTDTTATQRALEVGAEMLIMAKNGVDGVYDKDPRQHEDAELQKSITATEALAQNLGFADATSIALAREHNLPVKVVNLDDLSRAMDPAIGTTVQPV